MVPRPLAFALVALVALAPTANAGDAARTETVNFRLREVIGSGGKRFEPVTCVDPADVPACVPVCRNRPAGVTREEAEAFFSNQQMLNANRELFATATAGTVGGVLGEQAVKAFNRVRQPSPKRGLVGAVTDIVLRLGTPIVTGYYADKLVQPLTDRGFDAIVGPTVPEERLNAEFSAPDIQVVVSDLCRGDEHPDRTPPSVSTRQRLRDQLLKMDSLAGEAIEALGSSAAQPGK